jgi:hypothetical protein
MVAWIWGMWKVKKESMGRKEGVRYEKSMNVASKNPKMQLQQQMRLLFNGAGMIRYTRQ